MGRGQSCPSLAPGLRRGSGPAESLPWGSGRVGRSGPRLISEFSVDRGQSALGADLWTEDLDVPVFPLGQLHTQPFPAASQRSLVEKTDAQNPETH